MNFALDPQLERDSVLVVDGLLSQIRLSRNAAFPWLILVPRRSSVVEIIDLMEEDQQILLAEIRIASHIMRNIFEPKKLNVANIGNKVAQLHVHVVARFESDGAWPNPIWGSGITGEYTEDALSELVTTLQNEWPKK
jgi:diadenosine tetraphosphate (Ap4A) HIT family hydrolase